MRRARILLLYGTWIAILPYLGFPYAWKNVLFTLSGLGLVYFAYILYKEYKIKGIEQKKFDNFSENSDFEANKINTEGQNNLNNEENN